MTLTGLNGEIRFILGEATASFWTNDELNALIAEVIQEIQPILPFDAMKSIITTKTATPGATSSIVVPSSYFDFVSLRIGEDLLDLVSYDMYADISRNESNAALTGTSTRLFCYDSSGNLRLYPAMIGTTTYILRYIPLFATSGTLDLPTNPNIQQLVIFRSVALSATRKGRDYPTAQYYDAKYNELLGIIVGQYPHKHRITR